MASPFAERPIATIVSSHGAVLSLMATMLFHACKISSLVTPCLKACASICTSSINSSNFVQRYSNRLYLRKLSLHSVVSRILQKRKGHPGNGCRPRHSRRLNAQKESLCTGSYDAEILTHAQMFVQAENRTYFRSYMRGRPHAMRGRPLLRLLVAGLYLHSAQITSPGLCAGCSAGLSSPRTGPPCPFGPCPPAGNASASTMGVRGTSGSRPENARMSGRR